MKLPCLTALMSVSIAAAFAAPARAEHPGVEPSFTFTLSGLQEVDSAGNVAGDPGASAVATLTVDHGSLAWTITYENLGGDSITGLHLHPTQRQSEAPVLINLLPGFPAVTGPLPSPDGTLSGIVTPQDDPGLLTAMAGVFYGNAHNFYLHVHTAGPGGFPGGAMRGVLPEPGAPGLLALATLGILRRRR
jgi:hypothetical protein